MVIVRIMRSPKSLVTDVHGQPSLNCYISAVQIPQKQLSSGGLTVAAVKNSSNASRAKLGKVVSAYHAIVTTASPLVETNYVANIDFEGFIVLTFVNHSDILGQVCTRWLLALPGIFSLLLYI